MNSRTYFADGEGSGTTTITSTGTVPGTGVASPAAKPEDVMIPKSRFDEINERMKAAETKLADEEKAKEVEKTENLKKRGEWERVAAEASQKLAATQQALKDRDIRQEAYLEAVKANAVDPEAVYQLLDKTKITVAEDGTVAGASEAVAELLAAKPYLVKTAGGTGYIMGAGGSGHEPTAEDVSHMSMAEYRVWAAKHPNV